MTVLYIALAILLFGVLVGVHELGHFAAAKACGVKVEEFELGMGPAILQSRKARRSIPCAASRSAASAPWPGRTKRPTIRARS